MPTFSRPEVSAVALDNPQRRLLLGAAAAGGLALGLAANQASAAASEATTHATVKTSYVQVDGARFAYRRLGPAKGVPIVFFQHFRGTMDWWDPKLTDGLARTRPVIFFDNRGVGLSGGQTPNTIEAMAKDAGAFIDALGLKTVDLLGFSIGGMVAQELVLTRPELIRKVILAGTGPRGGQDMQVRPPEIGAHAVQPDGDAARAFLFFAQTPTSQAACQAFLARTAQRKTDLDPDSTGATMMAQGQALFAWGAADSKAGYLERLAGLKVPVLVVNGGDDIMVPTVNSYALQQAIPRAELILYPDSGHGAIFQYADLFVAQANLFLDRGDLTAL